MPAYISRNAHLNQLSHDLTLHYASAARQVEQLASGHRVNRSSDDPASLALVDEIASEVRCLAEGNRNLQQGVHMVQVAEGSLNTMSAILERMQQIATQSASGTYRDRDRTSMDEEFQALKEELAHIAQSTTYNDIHLLNEDSVLTVQSGPSTGRSDSTRIILHDLRPGSPRMFLDSLTLSTGPAALQAMDRIRTAQQTIIQERDRIAAYHNRLQMNAETGARAMERMRFTQSAIGDADVPAAVTRLTQSQILAQSAASVASQANFDVERVLGLLRG